MQSGGQSANKMGSLAAGNMPAKRASVGRQGGGDVQLDVDGDPIRMMGSSGNSAAWQASKSNHLRLFEVFRSQLKVKEQHWAPSPWVELTEEHLCNRELYGAWAYWLAREYLKPNGPGINGDPHLSYGSAMAYFNSLVALADAKVGKTSDRARLFFQCRDFKGSSDEAKWLQGLKDQIHRHIFQRCTVKNISMDMSADAIYPEDAAVICGALALEGSAEAADRKMIICSVTQGGCRAGELSFILVKDMRWDPHFKVVEAKSPMVKVSKNKIISFMAGVNRSWCWFLHWADSMVMNKRAQFADEFDEDEAPIPTPHFLIPSLQSAVDSSTKITAIIRDTCAGEEGGSKRYDKVRVKISAQRPSASGLRHGASPCHSPFSASVYDVWVCMCARMYVCMHVCMSV